MPKRDADHHLDDSVSESSKGSGSASESEPRRGRSEEMPEKAEAADLEDAPEAPVPTPARADRKSVGPSATSRRRYGKVSWRAALQALRKKQESETGKKEASGP